MPIVAKNFPEYRPPIMTQSRYVEIAVPGPFLYGFTYRVPPSLEEATFFAGQRVVVPLRKQEVVGFVHRVLPELPATQTHLQIKSMVSIIDTSPTLPSALYTLAEWAMRYYMAPPGEVYRALYPLYSMKRRLSFPLSPPVVGGDQGVFSLSKLTALQAEIYQKLLHSLEPQAFSPSLLYGITGSGKTEIYLHLMADVVARGGQVLFLLPEIGLTPQLSHRIRHVFGDAVAITHSQLTDKQRYLEWEGIRTGEKRIAVGTRSALFLPFQTLRLIVVDEEHDSSYKQEEGFRYHARDLAMVRAKTEKIPILLGSATPSLESLHNVESGKYRFYQLNERPLSAVLPTVRIIDLKRFRSSKGHLPLISEPLRIAVEERLAKRQQVLLFLNRRGYSTFVLCNVCGESLRCDQCSVAMAFHRGSGKCVCHYCLRDRALPLVCPVCSAPGLVKLGAGTERLEHTVAKLFPRARLLRVDRDVLQSKQRMAEFYQRMQDRDVDILMGTQLLAKGHDYPHITLVGVINADLELNFPDFRAEERCFQALLQVAGRAGRGRSPGDVMIQTLNPEHAIFRYISQHGTDAFWQSQLEMRRRFAYPPFAGFVQIEVSGTNVSQVAAHSDALARELKRTLVEDKHIALMGPSPAVIHQLRGHYRHHLILRSRSRPHLSEYIWRHRALFAKSPPAIRISIDVDPYSMM